MANNVALWLTICSDATFLVVDASFAIGGMAMSRVLFWSVLALATLVGFSAQSSTIENFEIVNSQTLSVGGGVFPGGGTYSGSFSLDTSELPMASQGILLSSFDITITGISPAEFSSATGGFGEYLATQFVDPTLGVLERGQLIFGGPGTLVLTLIEPLDTFDGGLVFDAQYTTGQFLVVGNDTTGSALISDALPTVTPVPPTWTLMLAGMIVFGAFTYGRRKQTVTVADAIANEEPS